MDVRLHDNLAEFTAAARHWYRRDPVYYTLELTLLSSTALRCDDQQPLMLTLHSDDRIAGAALQVQPFPLLGGGLAEPAIAAVVAELAPLRADLPGVRGSPALAQTFAKNWRLTTGREPVLRSEERLYRLGLLKRPVVPGNHRSAGDDDIDLLVAWVTAFEDDAFGEHRDAQTVENTIMTARRDGDSYLLWGIDGEPVSVAAVRPPNAGVSRIGPVYTPPAVRGRGYGSAVTAAAARWAIRVGAVDVVLFADLANPISNAIYRRMGFRPVTDVVRIDFRVR